MMPPRPCLPPGPASGCRRPSRPGTSNSTADTVDTPVLLIQGCDDEYGTDGQLEAIRAKVRGECRTVLLPQCGHFPHLDQRDAVTRVAAEFVAATTFRNATDRNNY